MNSSNIKGNVSFVNHEKKYIIVEYEQNGKKKTINANIGGDKQSKTKSKTCQTAY